jgi:glutamine synthetase
MPARLPRDLAAALDALQDNATLRGLVGDAFCQLFLEIKRTEWDAYSQQVSTWELQRYAGFF